MSLRLLMCHYSSARTVAAVRSHWRPFQSSRVHIREHIARRKPGRVGLEAVLLLL
jgi:hypothetical protein